MAHLNRFVRFAVSLHILSCLIIPSYCQESFDFSDPVVELRFRRDIGILASDSFQGRKAGTESEKLAADYIIRQFREAGLIPGVIDSSSWIQHFPIRNTTFPYLKNYFRSDHFTLVQGYQYGMTRYSADRSAAGPVVDVGYGMVDASAGIDDYSDREDVRGKMVLMEFALSEHYQKKMLPDTVTFIRERLKEAFSRGVTGVILWNMGSPGYKDLFDFSRRDSFPGVVVFVRSDVASAIRDRGRQAVTISTLVETRTGESGNVLGYVDNSAPYTIVFGAHYDHEGIKRDSIIFNGADDNASGTAMMLELARWLRQSGPKSHNYLFIAFGDEEGGMVGSEYFCSHPVIPWSTISYFFNFDMVGRLGAEGKRITAEGTGTSVYWKEVFRKLPGFGFRIRKFPAASDFSDQAGFRKRGVPIAYITTGLHSDYHTWRDTPEKINYSGMVRLFKFSAAFITASVSIDKVPFRKASGWQLFWSNYHYYSGQILHMLHTPWREMMIIME